ncbi:MAG: PAS domain-containing protein [Acidobacteriota bacterium]
MDPSPAAIANLRIEHALGGMTDAFILLDREFRVAFVNPAAEKIVGPAEPLVGHSHWELWPNTVNTEIERRYRRAMAQGQAEHFEHHYEGEGMDLWLEIHAYPGEAGLAVYFRDSSDRHLEQTKTARIERAYKAALSNTPDLVYVFDLNHRFIYANEALLTMWGRTWDDAIGKNCLELGYPDWHAAMHSREIEQVVATRQPIRGEVPFTGTHGRRIYEYIFVPVLGTDGEVESVAGTTRDITERQRSEEAVRRSEKLATAGRLASSIAHEINNPLEAVTNLLYLIDSDATLKPETRRFLDTARAELTRVSHITTQTLRFYRQSSKPTEELIESVLDSVVALYERRIRDAGVTLERDSAATEPTLVLAGELRQVVANLIGNALDASVSGGRILLRDRIATDWKTGRTGVRVTVADTGHGMSPATMQRLFEPFFTTKNDTGTGLGLWVSKEIVAKQSGQLRVRSSTVEPHRGTVFSLFVPAPETGVAKTSESA